MRGFLLCGLLLMTSSVYVDSYSSTTTDVPSSTTVAPTDEPRSTTVAPTDEPRSTTVAPTDEPRSTKTGPTDEPRSTTAGPTPKSTLLPSANPVTNAGTSGSPAVSTTTTLLPVTVKKAQVTMECNNGRCKYLLQVPRLSQAFLATQQGILADDKAAFATEETAYEKLQQNDDVTNIEAMFNEIYWKVNNATEEYKRIQTALKNIPSESLATNSSALRIQSYISTLRTQANTCLYDSCLQPTTTSTTTTTTPPTTTTPNPCKLDSCNCQADCTNDAGKAKCQPCNGNLDNESMCATSKCTAVGTSKAQSATDYSWLVSPGFDITNKNTNYYLSNLTCEWVLQIPDWKSGQYLTIVSDTTTPFTSMDPSSKLVLKCGGFSYTITRTSTSTKVNAALKTCTVGTLTFTFTSGNVSPGTAYFGVQLLNQPQDPTPTAPICPSSSSSTTSALP